MGSNCGISDTTWWQLLIKGDTSLVFTFKTQGQGSFLIPILKGQKHPSQLVVPWAWSHSSGQLEKFLLSSVRSSNAPSFFPWGPIFQLLPTHHLLSPGCQWVKGRLHFWQSLSNHSQYGKIIVIIKKFKKEKKPNRTPPNLEIPG